MLFRKFFPQKFHQERPLVRHSRSLYCPIKSMGLRTNHTILLGASDGRVKPFSRQHQVCRVIHADNHIRSFTTLQLMTTQSVSEFKRCPDIVATKVVRDEDCPPLVEVNQNEAFVNLSDDATVAIEHRTLLFLFFVLRLYV